MYNVKLKKGTTTLKPDLFKDNTNLTIYVMTTSYFYQ